MDIDVTRVAAELRSLCKGLAVRDPTLPARVGDQLRRVCRIDEGDKAEQIKRKLEHGARQFVSGEIAKDLREVLLTALGFQPGYDRGTLNSRLRLLAADRNMHVRTAQRKLDGAVELFAREGVAAALAASATGGVGYRVERLDVHFTLVGEEVRVVERRTIRATQRLETICCRACLPPPPPDQPQEVEFTVHVTGGSPRGRAVCSPSGAITHYVDLPQALAEGRACEFVVEYTIPPGRPVDPYCVAQPVTPFDSFSATVNFDPCRLPVRVWRVDGLLPPEVGMPPSDDRVLVQLDPSARARVEYDQMCQGRAYGLAWEPGADPREEEPTDGEGKLVPPLTNQPTG